MTMQSVGNNIKIVRFVDEDDDKIDPAAFRRDVMERSARYLAEVARVRTQQPPAPKAAPLQQVARPAAPAPKPAQRPPVAPTPAQQVKALADESKALSARLDRLNADLQSVERARSAQKEQARRDQEAREMNMFRW